MRELPLIQDKKGKKMTRKDFELIAGVFASFAEVCELEETIGADIARQMADALATTNPRFNRETFLKACGVN